MRRTFEGRFMGGSLFVVGKAKQSNKILLWLVPNGARYRGSTNLCGIRESARADKQQIKRNAFL